MSTLELQDKIMAARVDCDKVRVLLRALEGELDLSSNTMTDSRAAYIRTHFEDISTLYCAVSDYVFSLNEDIDKILAGIE